MCDCVCAKIIAAFREKERESQRDRNMMTLLGSSLVCKPERVSERERLKRPLSLSLSLSSSACVYNYYILREVGCCDCDR